MAEPTDEKGNSGKSGNSGSSAASAGPDFPFTDDLAFLYFWYHVDFINDVVHDVALDFYARPQAWRSPNLLNLDADKSTIADYLADLRAKYGTDREFPNAEQRSAVFTGLFGGDFSNYLQPVVAASSALAERVFETGIDALRESFRLPASNFKNYLNKLKGPSAQTSKADLLKFTERIYKILRDRNVQTVFASSEIAAQYPYDADAIGDELVAAMSTLVSSVSHMSSEVMNHQSAGLEGGKAIDAILAFDFKAATDVAKIDKLAGQVYTWLSALRMLRPQAVPAAPRVMPSSPLALASYNR